MSEETEQTTGQERALKRLEALRLWQTTAYNKTPSQPSISRQVRRRVGRFNAKRQICKERYAATWSRLKKVVQL